jgi:hypothetical protein
VIMPDIAMCHGDGCARRDACYRYRAVPSTRQAYFAKPPLGSDGTCPYFSALLAGDAVTGDAVPNGGSP